MSASRLFVVGASHRWSLVLPSDRNVRLNQSDSRVSVITGVQFLQVVASDKQGWMAYASLGRLGLGPDAHPFSGLGLCPGLQPI